MSQNPTSPTKQIQGIENHFRRNPSPPNYLKVLESSEQKKKNNNTTSTKFMSSYSFSSTKGLPQRYYFLNAIATLILSSFASGTQGLKFDSVISTRVPPRYVPGLNSLVMPPILCWESLCQDCFAPSYWDYESILYHRKGSLDQSGWLCIQSVLPFPQTKQNKKTNQPRKSSDDVPPARFA